MDSSLPRQKLSEIVKTFGQQIATDAEKCERLLKDCCPEHRREINALVSAIEVGVVERLRTGGHIADNDNLHSLSKNLEQDTGLTSDLSQWSVETWGIALNLLPESKPLAQPPETITSTSASFPTKQNLEAELIASGATKKSHTKLKWTVSLLILSLLGGGGVWGYQIWAEKVESQKAEEEAVRRAEEAKKVAQEQIRQVALKEQEEQRQLETRREKVRQEQAIETERNMKLEHQRLEQLKLENQRRQLDLQERQERARLDSQQRQQELREKQEQVRLENQRRQQELLEKQRQLQADRRKEAQERAAEQQQQRVLQQGIDALRRAK